MNSKIFKDILSKYYNNLVVAFLFFITIVLLFLIIPGESRFKYEFQKNAPWRHETLIAPFDFAILKPDEAIKETRDSVINNFIPFFNIDTLVNKETKQKFEQKLQSVAQQLPELKKNFSLVMMQVFEQIYNSGIIDQSPENYPQLQNKKELYIIEGKSYRKVPVSGIYSLKTAYQSLKNSIAQFYSENGNPDELIDMNEFLLVNLKYNAELNAANLEKAINSISTTQGVVQANERIIFKGDVVTAEKFQVLESLKANYKAKQGQTIDRYLLMLGKLIIICSCILLMVLYLAYFRPEIFRNKRHIAFIMFMIVLMVIVSHSIIKYEFLSFYAIPIAILPILFRIFFDSRTAIFGLMVTCLLCGYFAPNNFEFIFLHLIAGIISVFSLNHLQSRSDLVISALLVLLTYCVLYTAFSLVQEGNWKAIQWINMFWFAANAVLILLSYILIYIFEKVFGFISDVTLIELSNTNNPLLRKLQEEAPGTFQHSLQVASLAEAVIHQIGGNPFLVYAGALYHDIGKMKQPVYFTENQASGINPHSAHTYKESAQIIIDHVFYGLTLAQKYKLPNIITDFIRTHHGTMQAKYFYTMYKNELPNIVVDPKDFSYPGPIPSTKETAVVMITDGIEAASRALKEKSQEELKKLVDSMVQQKIDDGQLDDANLTIREINITKKTLLEKLINIYHARIEYPKDNSEEQQ